MCEDRKVLNLIAHHIRKTDGNIITCRIIFTYYETRVPVVYKWISVHIFLCFNIILINSVPGSGSVIERGDVEPYRIVPREAAKVTLPPAHLLD